MECSINVNEVKLVDVVQVSDIFTDFLSVLLVIERRILKSPTSIVDLSISPCSSISLHVF